MMALESDHSNSVVKQCNQIVFKLVGFVLLRTKIELKLLLRV